MMTRCPLLMIAILAGIAAGGCGARPEATDSEAGPAHVEPIEGSDLHVVTLTARAAERVGIATAPVVDVDGRLVIPYSALFYDAEGGAWAYVEERRLAYVRHALTVDVIEGDRVFLAEGPSAGTFVVSVGAAELFGTEFEVGH